MKYTIWCIFSCIVLFFACAKDEINYSAKLDVELAESLNKCSPNGNYDYYKLPSSSDLNRIPQDDKNPLTEAKVELGKLLFYESSFSSDAFKEIGNLCYSCASCHIPDIGFRAGNVQGIADGGIGFGNHGDGREMSDEYQEHELDIQGIRPLSLLNVAFVSNTFWNGQFGATHANEGTEAIWSQREDTNRNHLGYKALETQNFEGIKAHRIKVDEESVIHWGYKDLFDQSFPEFAENERYTNITGSLALSAYLRSLVTNEAPFQSWLNGESHAMSDEEKEGAILFFGKANCANCHYEKNLGSAEFHVLATKDMDQHPEALNKNEFDRRNLGRGGFTGRVEDNYKFKVPGLYNVGDARFYFHGSSKESLEDVICYKLEAKRENPRVPSLSISEKLLKIQLTESEVNKLALFLRKSLKDSNLQRFKPDSVLSGNCFPNNDPISKVDLGCD